MGKIYIRTYAYNAEKTLRRTVESVLNQTHQDFEYYLCDNGSTDATRKIVEEYAVLDKRVKPFYNTVNRAFRQTEECLFLPYNIDDDDLFCVLDADDEYKPTFFEEMLAFINEYNLDIAACGSDFLSVAENNKLVTKRLMPQNLILENQDFVNIFPEYHQFMRTTWGKLSKGKTLREAIQDSSQEGFPRAYGGDTFNTMLSFTSAKRVGILARSLHKYYVSVKSVSYEYNPQRVETDQILHKATIKYLLAFGDISARNMEFLYIVYFNAIKDSINVIVNSNTPPIEKLNSLQEIFACEYTKILFRDYFEKFNLENLRTVIVKFILSQKVCRNPDGAKIAGEILANLNESTLKQIKRDYLEFYIAKIPEVVEYIIKKDYSKVLSRLNTWRKKHNDDEPAIAAIEISVYHVLNKPIDEVFALLINVKKKFPKSSDELNIENQIKELVGKTPLLQKISFDLIFTFSNSVRLILKGNFLQALEAFVSTSNKIEIPAQDTESYIIFGQNLSASAENPDYFVYFKKLWIRYLIEQSRNSEALKELDEFAQLLPNDEDFKSMKILLSQ